jgi:hypothetical protein
MNPSEQSVKGSEEMLVPVTKVCVGLPPIPLLCTTNAHPGCEPLYKADIETKPIMGASPQQLG